MAGILELIDRGDIDELVRIAPKNRYRQLDKNLEVMIQYHPTVLPTFLCALGEKTRYIHPQKFLDLLRADRASAEQAVQQGYDPSYALWHVQDRQNAAWLLEHGADPNTTFLQTSTLAKQIWDKNFNNVQLLLQWGAKPEEGAIKAATTMDCPELVKQLQA